jgi:hypothetical protein
MMTDTAVDDSCAPMNNVLSDSLLKITYGKECFTIRDT